MELNIDLLKKKKKSLFRVILGILFFLIASAWIITSIIERGIIRPFDWVYFGVFTLNAIVHFFEGLGYSPERFLGKAYIVINSELISLKATISDKRQCIEWSEIKSIDYNPNIVKYKIKRTNDTTMIIDVSKFDYSLLCEIKKTINCIAKEKNISE